MRLILRPHPSIPPPTEINVFVDCEITADGLELTFQLSGELSQLRLAEPNQLQRQDGLWQHSCFECFLATHDQPGYEEYNFAPDLAWARYLFSAYRQDQRNGPAPNLRIEPNASASTYQLRTQIPLPAPRPLRIGLSAVLESHRGELSYWALHHADAEPDFHHPDSFVLRLDERNSFRMPA